MNMKPYNIWRTRTASKGGHSYAWIRLSIFPPLRIYQMLKFRRYIKDKRHNMYKHPWESGVYIINKNKKDV